MQTNQLCCYNDGTNLLISMSQTHVIMSKIVVLWSLTLKTLVYTHYFVSYLQYWLRYSEKLHFADLLT